MRSPRTMACLFVALTVLIVGSVMAQQKPLDITGRVVDSDGQSVADAHVALIATGSESNSILTSVTDSEGNFRLEVGAASADMSTMIAWKEGYGVGHLPRQDLGPEFSGSGGGNSAPPPKDVRIQLPPVQPVTFKVVDPAGLPVANAIVWARSIRLHGDRPFFYAGDDADVELLQRRTNAGGVVTIDYLPPGAMGGLAIGTATLDRQNVVVSAKQAEQDLTLRLRPTTHVKFRLSSDDKASLSERKITLNIRADTPIDISSGEPILRVVWAGPTLVTDEDGVAEAKVMAGRTSVYMAPRPGDTFFPDTSNLQGITLIPGETAEYSIPFKPGVKLRGRVVDTQGRPVADVRVQVIGQTLATDENGIYETSVPATGPIYCRTLSVPAGYVMPYDTFSNAAQIVEGQSEVDQPDIIIESAVQLRGTVVDREGSPMANASVVAAWQASDPQGRSFTLKSEQTTSDTEGRFAFGHVLQDADVRLTARTETMASAAKVLHTSEPQDVELQVSEDGMLNIVGSVRGANGTLIEHAEVEVSRALLDANGHTYGQRVVPLQGKNSFVSKQAGAFVTPHKLPRFEHYSLKIGASGFLSEQTTFLIPGVAGDLDIGEILLVPVRTFSGTLTDSAGKPVQGATIAAYSSSRSENDRELMRVSTTSDYQGKFTLEQLHPRAAMALVQKDGYRLSGLPLLLGGTGELTLYRDDETIPIKHRITVSELDATARRPAAEKLISTFLERRRNSNYFYTELCQMLLRIDRDAALVELDQAESATSRATMLAEFGEVGEAFSEAASISDAYSRCRAMLAVAKKSDDEAFWRDALATVLVEAEQIMRPDYRLATIRGVADEFYERGDEDYAKTIITGHLAQAETLSISEGPGYIRASFAESLALFDFDTAMKLVGEADEQDRARHYQNMAHRLAAINPAAAEQVIGQIGRTNYIDSPVVRVAYRMAKVDLPRALGLLEQIDSVGQGASKARAFGVIAVSIVEKDPEKARELLQQGFDAIPKQATGLSSWSELSFGTALTLLRYAEQVDPEHLTDYFWQTVQNYGGPRGNAWSPQDEEEKNAAQQAQMAILLALYSQPTELVLQVAAPVFDYWERQIEAEDRVDRFVNDRVPFIAMALADPVRAAQWAIAFDDSLNEQARRYIPQPWEVVGKTLTYSREEICKQLTRDVYHSWVIDEYNF